MEDNLKIFQKYDEEYSSKCLARVFYRLIFVRENLKDVYDKLWNELALVKAYFIYQKNKNTNFNVYNV